MRPAKPSTRLRRAALAVWLLAAGLCRAEVVISEFMAYNTRTLTNSLGTTDWIELYNSSTSAVNLAGWYLTDRPGNLRAWTFPEAVIQPHGYLLVYASDPPSPVTNGELHATFKLAREGGFLALVEPDGTTIASPYDPYPEQTADVSFGLRPEVTELALVPPDAFCRYLVPSNDAVDAVWMSPTNFDDTGWAVGAQGVGYEFPTTNFAALLATRVPENSPGVYLRFSFAVESAEALDTLTLQAKYDDGFVAYLNGTQVLAESAAATSRWDSLASAEHANDEAVSYEDFDLSLSAGLLHEGTNILAVHALNAALSLRISDLLMALRLDGAVFRPGPGHETRYFHVPTPGAENRLGEEDYLQRVGFSVPRGYYDLPFHLTLAPPATDCVIYYTTDGTVPWTNNGALYTGPIPITNTVPIRARAFKTHYEPSAADTHTYLFADEILARSGMAPAVVHHPEYGPRMRESLFALRTVSFVTAASNFFGPSGIYVNALQQGVAWERPLSMEWIDPHTGESTQVNCGVRIYGGWGRRRERKPFRLFFKKQYGPTEFAYDVFTGDDTAARTFNTLIFRADGAGQPFTVSGIIDGFVRDTQIALSAYGSRSTFVHLFINGEYWGIYNPSERPDQAFGASYYDDRRDAWDAINSGYACSGSSLDSWKTTIALIAAGLADNDAYQRIQGNLPDGTPDTNGVVYLDVDNHIDYILTHFWAGTGDWGYSKNWYAGCSSRAPDNTGWKFWVWDAEASILGAYGLGADRTALGGPMNIFWNLRENAEFRLRFADHARRHLFDGGGLTPAVARARYAQMADLVEPALLVHAARWGNETTPQSWRTTSNWILDTYFDQRWPVFLRQLRSARLYPSIDAPAFSRYGGVVPAGFTLGISASNTVYYTLDGTDPRERLTGNPLGREYAGPILLDSSALVRARARAADGEWSALTEAVFAASNVVSSLRLSEVMYHPAAPVGSTNAADDFEFVEVVNAGAEAIDLRLARLEGGARFAFPALALPPGACAVVVKNLAAFAQRYDTNTIRVAGQYDGNLANGGERLRLTAPGAVVLAACDYDDGREWPLAADGAGHSLVPLTLTGQADGALDYGGNWRASAFIGGSPGAPDPAPPRDVVLNEIMAHTDYADEERPEYDSNDWLELFNTQPAAIPLDGWYLSDDPQDLRKWAIPATNVIGAHARLTFDEVTGFHSPITNGFGLNKDGEWLYLSCLLGGGLDRVADCVEFESQEPGVALGRHADGESGWFTLVPTPDAPNRRDDEPRVIIAEVMYHPSPRPDRPGDNTRDEYIEIANVGSNAVSLCNEAGAWRLAGGVEYTFPSNTVLQPKQCLIVVSFGPDRGTELADFLAVYGLTNGEIAVLGPYDGKLSNRGDRIALERPQAPDLPDEPVSWVLVDEVVYSDQTPWPPAADGVGFSLQRTAERGLGTDPASWSGELGSTPGQPRAKLSLTAPPNGAVFVLPFSTAISATVDAELVAGDIRAVEFWLGGSRVGVATSPPYAYVWRESTAAGTFTFKARLIDDEGTNVSRFLSLKTLTLENSQPPADVTDTSARLRGRLVGHGTAPVSVYWGTADGGTNDDAWAASKPLGALGSGEFFFDLAGLDPGRRYWYRCFACGAGGNEGWAPASADFTTLSHRAWTHQMQVTFGGYTHAASLSNFPALVVLSTNIPGFRYETFSFPANGGDLRFTDAAGTRALNFEVEQWDTNGASHVWVQVPMLSSSNDFISAYWGHGDAGTLPACTLNGAAWDPTFRAVCHLSGGPHDATPNETESQMSGTSAAQGAVGPCRSFNGVDDAISSGIHHRWFGANIRNLTISCWVNPATTGPGCPFGTEDTDFTNRFFIGNARGGKWQFSVLDAAVPHQPVEALRWQLLTFVFDQNRAYGYGNGSPAITVGDYPDFEPPTGLVIGGRTPGTLPFAGLIDEVRVSQVARPADWIWAEYMTVASNAAFTRYEIVRTAPVRPWDEDGDGMADSWETEQFGATNAAGGGAQEDWDSDGMQNRAEYVAGTTATSGADRFTVAVERMAQGAVRMGFQTRPATGANYVGMSRHYALEDAAAFTGGFWMGVAGYTDVLATGEMLWYTNGTEEPSPAFYRGKVWLEE